MLRCPPGHPTWADTWALVMDQHAHGWNTGRTSTETVYGALADRTGMTFTQVEAHAKACCRQLAFNDTAWATARRRLLPQALVTVNPDIVPELIVPEYGLDDVFDVIVTSSAEGTDDKPTLCDIALQRLGHTGDRRDAVLIDNRADLVAAWRSLGGAAYCFTTDQAFQADLPTFGLPRP